MDTHNCVNHVEQIAVVPLAVSESGRPILIKYNIGDFTTYLFHFMGQTVFGTHTDEVVAYCADRLKKLHGRRLAVGDWPPVSAPEAVVYILLLAVGGEYDAHVAALGRNHPFHALPVHGSVAGCATVPDKQVGMQVVEAVIPHGYLEGLPGFNPRFPITGKACGNVNPHRLN